MINNEERIKNTPVKSYKEIFGVEKAIFDRMLKILNTTKAFHKETTVGRKPKLEELDCLVITLMYWREYRTFRHIAYDYEVGKSSVGRAILLVEDTLISSGEFNLKSKRELRENLSKIEVVVIDVTEQEIERPKRGREKWYSGKQKCHTIKTLIIADAKTNEILAIAQDKGKTHDFKMFKEQREYINDDIELLADSGFQGILAFHKNSLTPIKKSKNKPLTEESKAYKHNLSKRRIVIENINRRIKRFDIFSDRYRNKRRRHGLRMTLFCDIHNMDSIGF